MRYRRPHLRKLRAGAAVAVALILLFWADRAMTPPLLAYAQQQAHQLAVLAVDRAVRRVLAEGNISYPQLVRFQRDERGRVTSYQVDTVQLARIVADLQRAIQEELPPDNGATIPIPLGVLLGSELLAAYGPRIQALVVPVGQASVTTAHRFEQAGINQARHLIYAVVEARVRIVLPLHREEAVVRTELPLVDTVIVGDVPPAWLTPWPAPAR